MHIGFRTSGGRGEYEVVGTHSGYTAISLEGWTFHMRWPDGIVRDTGLMLEPADSGKPRLRSQWQPQFQIGRMVAAMLMLPDPTRSFKQTPATLPIEFAKKYSITRVGFSSDSEFTGINDQVTFAPSFVMIQNQGHQESIGVTARWARLAAVYAKSAVLPTALHALIKGHHDYLASGLPVQQQLTTIVTNISRQLHVTAGSGYVEGADALLALERLLGIAEPTGPNLPPPDELGEDEPEVSARSAHQYRLARARGPAARKFGDEVREAYGNRCAFCGAKFGGIPGIPRSGIDAAHILAWSKHDLDIVQNGIALCKLHHWAFDAGIIMPMKEGDDYYMRFTSLAELIDPISMDRLGADGERIPDEWLPADPNRRPSQHYLDLLYADLGVTFKDSV